MHMCFFEKVDRKSGKANKIPIEGIVCPKVTSDSWKVRSMFVLLNGP